MKIRAIILGLLAVLLLGEKVSTAQNADRRNATLHPCPGGTGSAEVETPTPTSLDQLVQMSELIVVGTVANVLPAINTNPNVLISIETHSLVAVEELLYGTLPPRARTILLVQMGGKAGPCALVVPADPLVQNGEQYVFFLRADDRTEIPNTSGALRYVGVGVWGGEVKVVNGKIEFPPSASPRLHEHDNAESTAFVATVKERISVLLPIK